MTLVFWIDVLYGASTSGEKAPVELWKGCLSMILGILVWKAKVRFAGREIRRDSVGRGRGVELVHYERLDKKVFLTFMCLFFVRSMVWCQTYVEDQGFNEYCNVSQELRMIQHCCES